MAPLLTCTRLAGPSAWKDRHASTILQRLYHHEYSSNSTATSTTTRPIVIVGGGPVGLFLSNLLSSCYNMPSIVLESQSVEDRFQHPQAHFLNTRTMEILRSHLPNIYQDVVQAMPPKQQWQAFQYTHCLSSPEPLATVIHPVHAPIQAGVDANGTLLFLDHGAESSSFTKKAKNDRKQRRHPFLSPCTVGHLAQHTFGRILYEAAVRAAANRVDGSGIYYESRVTKVSGTTNDTTRSNLMQVTTADGRVFETDLVVAADGANSLLRSWNKIGWSCINGKVQHIMNIHVNLTNDQVDKLHHRLHDDDDDDDDGNGSSKKKNFAMLYSVYSSQAVAMVVCHDLGDYVVQIPYFPPMETEMTFRDAARLGPMLESIFGFPICLQTQVVSIGKWTMSTRVAESYYAKNNNNSNNTNNVVVLVGDAGHVFPPAGGFGMNTGIQDAHNLGWKLAWAMRRQRQRRQKNDNNNKKWKAVFESYDQERRPVALRNAALAHRNYHRVLETIRQCYLDDEIPTMVTKALAAAPFLPSFGKTFTFRALQQTVMAPLSWLETSRGLYREHIKANLRRVLQRGMGLPLVFPRHELFFTYDKHKNGVVADDLDDMNNNNWYRATDTMAPLHINVVVGQRLPHVDIQVLSSPPSAPWATSTTCTSTIDLAAHVARQHGQPAFCLLHVVRDFDSTTSTTTQEVDRLQRLAQSLSTQMEIPVEVIHLDTNAAATAGPSGATWDLTADAWVVQLATAKDQEEEEQASTAAGNVVFPNNPFTSLLVSSCDSTLAALILVRPDGHVAHLVTNYKMNESSNTSNSSDSTDVEGDLLQAALQSGGALIIE